MGESTKAKPQYYDTIFKRLLALESFTTDELRIFDQVYSNENLAPELVNGIPTSAFLYRSLATLKDKLKISPTLEAKIKTHIDFMGSILIGFGSGQDFFGFAGLAFHYSNGIKAGAEEITPFIAECLPDDIALLKAINSKLNSDEFATLFGDGTYSMFSHSLALIETVCKHKLHPPQDKIDPNETAEESGKNAKKQKTIEEAVKLAAKEEEYFLAVTQLQHANAEFLQGLQPKNTEEFIISELKKEQIWHLYENKVVRIHEKKNDNEAKTETSSAYIDKPTSIIFAEIQADYEAQDRFITSTLNQNKKLLHLFYQYTTAKEIEQVLGKQGLTAKQTIDHADTVLKKNAIYFQNNEVNKDSNATKFFKRMAEIITFGLAKKLWTQPKETTGERFIKQTTLFSSPKQKSVGKAEDTDIPAIKLTH